jgi:hypothetical protein
VEYSLTAYGRTLRPVLHELCKWGEKHMATAMTAEAESASAGIKTGARSFCARHVMIFRRLTNDRWEGRNLRTETV